MKRTIFEGIVMLSVSLLLGIVVFAKQASSRLLASRQSIVQTSETVQDGSPVDCSLRKSVPKCPPPPGLGGSLLCESGLIFGTKPCTGSLFNYDDERSDKSSGSCKSGTCKKMPTIDEGELSVASRIGMYVDPTKSTKSPEVFEVFTSYLDNPGVFFHGEKGPGGMPSKKVALVVTEPTEVPFYKIRDGDVFRYGVNVPNPQKTFTFTKEATSAHQIEEVVENKEQRGNVVQMEEDGRGVLYDPTEKGGIPPPNVWCISKDWMEPDVSKLQFRVPSPSGFKYFTIARGDNGVHISLKVQPLQLSTSSSSWYVVKANIKVLNKALKDGNNASLKRASDNKPGIIDGDTYKIVDCGDLGSKVAIGGDNSGKKAYDGLGKIVAWQDLTGEPKEYENKNDCLVRKDLASPVHDVTTHIFQNGQETADSVDIFYYDGSNGDSSSKVVSTNEGKIQSDVYWRYKHQEWNDINMLQNSDDETRPSCLKLTRIGPGAVPHILYVVPAFKSSDYVYVRRPFNKEPGFCVIGTPNNGTEAAYFVTGSKSDLRMKIPRELKDYTHSSVLATTYQIWLVEDPKVPPGTESRSVHEGHKQWGTIKYAKFTAAPIGGGPSTKQDVSFIVQLLNIRGA